MDEHEIDYDALSDDELMERVKRSRDIMNDVRGARAFIEARNNDPALIMAGFLHYFHPDMSHQQQRELVQDARRQR